MRPGNGAGPFLQPRSPHGANVLILIRHITKHIWSTALHYTQIWVQSISRTEFCLLYQLCHMTTFWLHDVRIPMSYLTANDMRRMSASSWDEHLHIALGFRWQDLSQHESPALPTSHSSSPSTRKLPQNPPTLSAHRHHTHQPTLHGLYEWRGRQLQSQTNIASCIRPQYWDITDWFPSESIMSSSGIIISYHRPSSITHSLTHSLTRTLISAPL